MKEYFLIGRPREAEFDRLAELACRAVSADAGLITLIGEGRQFFLAHFGLGEPWASWRETPLSHSFCCHVAEMDRPLVVDASNLHPLVQRNPAVTDLGVAAYLGLPIHAADGAPVGAVCAIQHRPRQWSEADKTALRLIAQLVDAQIRHVTPEAA